MDWKQLLSPKFLNFDLHYGVLFIEGKVKKEIYTFIVCILMNFDWLEDSIKEGLTHKH